MSSTSTLGSADKIVSSTPYKNCLGKSSPSYHIPYETDEHYETLHETRREALKANKWFHRLIPEGGKAYEMKLHRSHKVEVLLHHLPFELTPLKPENTRDFIRFIGFITPSIGRL